MVYIDENTDYIFLPKTSDEYIYKISFVNQTTHVSFDIIEPIYWEYTLSYEFDFYDIVDRFEVGQYDYYLYNEDDVIIDSGILQFGELSPLAVSYENKIEYIQYTPN